MAMFRKLKLVSEEELARLKQRQLEQYEPKLRSMARIQNQVENLLSSTSDSLTSNERLRLLEMLQQRFREMKPASIEGAKGKKDDEDQIARVVQEDARAPVAGAVVRDEEDGDVELPATKPTVKPEAVETSTLLNNTILSTISTRKKREAQEKLAEFAKHPSILSYNNKLEAVVNNETIPGSNFIDLFKSLFSSKSKSASLVGFEKFQNAVGNIELYKPSSSSTSPALASRLRSTTSSAIQNPPPGMKPNVLRVYDVAE